MVHESLSKCGRCDGTGDQLKRPLMRRTPAFQQCPDCAGEGMVPNFTEVLKSLDAGMLRLGAANGKYQINGDDVTLRFFRAVLEIAMIRWETEASVPKPAARKAEPKKAEPAVGGEADGSAAND